MVERSESAEPVRQPSGFEVLLARTDELLEGHAPQITEWNRGLVDSILRRNNPKYRTEFREADIRLRIGYDGVLIREYRKFVDGVDMGTSRRLIGYYMYDRGSWMMGQAVWEAVLDYRVITEEDARAMLDNIEGRIGSRQASEGALSKFKVDHGL